ncbi:phage major capsid protein [Ancylobacter defluvii]|uniref:Phage capsid protein n=1 Tax=Ancylobacter defluvii TaxID=1282440 RepID=A0A9W6NCL4_9HYPH|nr:phage major capsid protein [Ancylobacter defluvii]MBS7588283.1 phage major capsid protein [Ancylobacter defluvii]GLK86679.1 phage capsid protein [Ancylobacter defluvii]
MRPDIAGLRQERAKAMEKFDGLAAQAGLRALNEEEQASFDQLEADIKGIDGRIRAAERAQALRASTAIPAPAGQEPGATVPPATVPAQPRSQEEPGIDLARYTRAITASRGNLSAARDWAVAQFGEGHPVVADIGAAMQTNDMSSGGVFVPERLSSQLIQLLYPRTVIRRISRVVPLVGGTDTIPTVEKGVNAYYIGEGNDITTDEPSFGALSFKEREIASLVPLSNKLIRLSSVGIDTYVRDMMVQGFAQAEDGAFLRGTGVGAGPKGLRYLILPANIFNASGAAAPTAAQIDSDTRKLLLALSGADIPMINPRWLMHDRVFLFLQDLRDANGNKVYPGLEAAQPNFRGYPVERFNRIPTNLDAGGGNLDGTEIYFGDFSFSMIADSYRIRIDANEAAAYKVGNEMVSAYSRNQTLIRGLAGHDYGVSRRQAFAMLNNVRWGA